MTRQSALVAVVAFLFLGTACIAPHAAGEPAATTSIEPKPIVAPTTTVVPTTTTTSPASELRRFLAAAGGVSPAITDYVASTGDRELNDLAAVACELVEPDMSPTELGVVAISVRESLGDERPELDDFNVVFGALAGIACPERLPLDDWGLEPPAPAGDADSFRGGLIGMWQASESPARFLRTTDDDRIESLGDTACADFVGPASSDLVDASSRHYDEILTAEERALITRHRYREMFGALVGWFCPGQLPTIG